MLYILNVCFIFGNTLFYSYICKIYVCKMYSELLKLRTMLIDMIDIDKL